MSSPDKHIRSWSSTDVHKYLRGDLSAREMHALEKAALDDPFLADALEGLATPPVLELDLAELRTRLDERVAEKKSRLVLLPRIRVAAAVILLAGIGVTAIITTSKHKAGTAKTVPLPSPDADVASGLSAKPAAPEPAATQTQPTPDREVASSSNAGRSATPTRRQAPPVASRAREADIQNIADSLGVSNSVAGATVRNEASISTYSLKKDTIPYKASAIDNNKSFLQSKPLLFAGQVLDINNRPVAGASLFLEGKNVVTVTDNEGYFKLYVPPRDTIRTVRVHFAGYDETSVALDDDNRFGNVITLKERQGSLQEVVVTGFSTKRKETMVAPPSDDAERLDSLWTRAAPTIGRVAYLDYLAAGKKGLGADSTTRGTVSISFDIGQNGQPSDFKIEQSLSPVQDAGVIRLISEGSAWQLFHGKKARLLVSLSFP